MAIQCKRCGSYKVTPSGKRGLSKIFGYFPFIAFYRCKDCWVRFWTFQSPFQSLFSKIMAGVIVVLFAMLYVLSAMQHDSISDSRAVKKSVIRMKIQPVYQENTNQKQDEAQNVQPKISKSTENHLKKSDEISLKTQSKLAARKETNVGPSLAGERFSFNLIGIESYPIKKELRVVLLADHAIEKYETFLLDTPSRLVVDLPGKWKNTGYSELKLNVVKLQSIRIGEHPDKLRIVFDLANKKPIPPIVKKSSRGLILILK